MRQTDSWRGKILQFLLVLLPIFITQAALSSTGFFDTVMSGHASEYDLAGVAIGVNLWMPVFTAVLGVISGLTPIVAQKYGGGRHDDMQAAVIQGLYLALAIAAAVIVAGALLIDPVMAVLGLEARVEAVARGFLTAIAFGIPPLFAAAVLRCFIDALGYTRVTMLVTLCAVPINVCMNYLFIFGQFGFPRLGGVGAGVGSAITYWGLMAVNVAVVTNVAPFRGYRVLARLSPVSLTAWREHLRIGLPIGGAIFCEVSIFGAVAIFMAEYGTAVIAAHQAAINFASMVYMIPLSISMALTILVGFEVGGGRFRDARLYSYLGIGVAVGCAGVFSIALVFATGAIAGLYTNSPGIARLIESFLAYVIFFQMSDAVAAPIQGALRGYKDVNAALIMAIASYWVIGLPAGFLLARYAGFGPYGYWLGFIIGLAAGAVMLLIRLRRLQRTKYP